MTTAEVYVGVTPVVENTPPVANLTQPTRGKTLRSRWPKPNGVLANDTDAETPNTLSAGAGSFTATQGGTIVFAADGSYTYTPPTDFIGTDTVSYTVTDGSASSTGTLTLTVTQKLNTPPDGTDGTLSLAEDNVVIRRKMWKKPWITMWNKNIFAKRVEMIKNPSYSSRFRHT